MEKHTCSWVGKLNIVTIWILLKLIHKFNSITVKFPAGVFTELDKLIRKFMCERKCTRIAKIILKGKNNEKGDLDLLYQKSKYFIFFQNEKCVLELLFKIDDSGCGLNSGQSEWTSTLNSQFGLRQDYWPNNQT